MKSAQKNTPAANIQQKANTPFFQAKESEATANERTFFTKNDQAKPSFLHRSPSPTIQAKLTIGQPGDKYEREADAVADRVVSNKSVPSPLTDTPSVSPIQRKCSDCEQKEKLQKKEGEEEVGQVDSDLQLKPIFDSGQEPPEENASNDSAAPGLMRKCSACGKEEMINQKSEGADGPASPSLQSRLNSSKGSGSTLPDPVRSSMESGIGADFSGVRVHTDASAVQMNKELGAQAFTHGSDIYFNEGKYDSGSSGGRHLLAHELTHTVQQGAAVQKKPEVSKISKSKIQRSWLSDGVEYVKGKIADGLNWLAEKTIPGYSLLNVILGKNLITDDPVPRTGENIIKGYMELLPVIGSILFNELKETESLNDASVWVEEQVGKFGIDFNQIAKNLNLMWEELSFWNSMKTNVAIFRKYVSPWLNKFLNFSGTVQEKVKALRLEGALRLVGAHELLQSLKKSPAALKRVVDNPKLIFKFFIDALKKGFQSFKDNFGQHFKNALFGWLFGKAAEMGITMPKQLNIAGLFSFIAQILGATYQQIRGIVVKKLGPKGEKIVSRLEQTAEIVIDFMTKGPIALWERVKEFLVNLKETIFSKITALVTGEIIKTAVTKLVSMLNPAGAIVQLAMTIYRVVKYFIDWWDTIKEIASGILSSITKVALGSVGAAAKFIENLFGKGMKLVIAFLARIFGLGGIATKVKQLLKKISAPVQEVIGKVVGWIVDKGKALFNKLTGKGKTKEEAKGSFTEEDKKAGLSAFENEEKPFLEQNAISKENANEVAGKVKKKHPVFKSISVVDGGNDWEYKYIFRSSNSVSTPSSKALEYNITDHDSQPSPRKPYNSHHIIQDKWAISNLESKGYSSGLAPTILLDSTPGAGNQHNKITQRQRVRRDARMAQGKGKWSTTLQQEIENAKSDLIFINVPNDKISEAMSKVYSHFSKWL